MHINDLSTHMIQRSKHQQIISELCTGMIYSSLQKLSTTGGLFFWQRLKKLTQHDFTSQVESP